MPKLLLATRNAHKTREFRELLGDEFELLDLSAFPEIPDIAETGRNVPGERYDQGAGHFGAISRTHYRG